MRCGNIGWFIEEMVFALSFKNDKNKEVREENYKINNMLINKLGLLFFCYLVRVRQNACIHFFLCLLIDTGSHIRPFIDSTNIY